MSRIDTDQELKRIFKEAVPHSVSVSNVGVTFIRTTKGHIRECYNAEVLRVRNEAGLIASLAGMLSAVTPIATAQFNAIGSIPSHGVEGMFYGGFAFSAFSAIKCGLRLYKNRPLGPDGFVATLIRRSGQETAVTTQEEYSSHQSPP